MTMMTINATAIGRPIFRHFAVILDYPDAGLAAAARACAVLLAPINAEAAALLGAFRAFAEATPLGRMQEVYTGTFDLDATCHPYVGYHLFGESYQRSALLVGLKERYQAHGFSTGNELPDHLVVMLRFLAVCPDTDLAIEISRDAVLPALRRMLGEHDQPDEPADGAMPPNLSNGSATRIELRGSPRKEAQEHPYSGVLQALRVLLQHDALWATYAAYEGGSGHA